MTNGATAKDSGKFTLSSGNFNSLTVYVLEDVSPNNEEEDTVIQRIVFPTLFLIGLMILGTGTPAHAQMKIRYINSDRILKEYPQAQEVQRKLDELRSSYEAEFNRMQQEAQKLLDELQNQSLLLSPEKKAEKENKLQNLQAQLERFYQEKLGPQGEFYRKNQELTQPLIDKINQVIQKVGQEEGYDYILDVVQGVVLYAKEEYDITDRILEELNKTQ
ncbi:MAG: OmpH family outer membrane protein [Calditrichaeota bacterium]|nr:MAG: OmpH family outer membrane protein [Calditrichota bacterium]